MRITPLREQYKLRTERVTRTIIGGKQDNSLANFGYVQGDDGIKASHSFAPSQAGYAISSLERVERVNPPGYTFGVTLYGDTYLMTTSSMVNFPVYVGYSDDMRLFYGFPEYEGRRVFAIAEKTTVHMITGANETADVPMPIQVRCGCFHADRMFACDYEDGYLIRWSGSAFNDWTESADGAGSLRLDPSFGEVLNMYSLRDRVIALREYGISAIRALGDPRNFAVDRDIAVSFNRRVSSPYAVKCDGKLYFACDDCIYSFDGNSLESLSPDRAEGLHGFRRPAAYEDRFVYFECETDASEHSYILEYDLKNGHTALFGEDCVNFWRDDEGCHCFKNGQFMSSMYGGGDMVKKWTSRGEDLGIAGVKTLKSLFISGRGDVTVTVLADGVSRDFAGFGVHRADMRGRTFTFCVSGECDVTELTAEWEVSA